MDEILSGQPRVKITSMEGTDEIEMNQTLAKKISAIIAALPNLEM